MGIDSVIRWFLPREAAFQKLFQRDTDNLVAASKLFLEIAENPSLEARHVKVVALKAIEHRGDEVTRLIFESLNSTFITPLDREDIRELAVTLDDVLDYLESIARSLVIFEIDQAPEPLVRFAKILDEMVGEIERATPMVWNLSNEKRIHEAIVRISDLENEADALYVTVIADLFRRDRGRDAVDILKWKEIYQGLEDASDACKEFTHILANVVIKSA